MKKWLGFLFITMMFLLSNVSVAFAEQEEKRLTDGSGILQIVIMYTDEEGKSHPVQGGSGFLIGNKESGAQYIITSNEVTTVSEEKKELLSAELATEEDKLKISMQVVVRRDVMVTAQLIAESDEMGFAVWKLSQPLYDRQVMILYDGAIAGMSGQKISVLGFPLTESQEEIVYYVREDVIANEGTLIGDGKQGNVKYLYHDISPMPGTVGGPIVNSKGEVLGLNLTVKAQEGYYALQISEMLPVLEALGIPYTTSSQVEAAKAAELAAIVHKEELQQAVTAAEAINQKLYKNKTIEDMQLMLEAAKVVIDDADATQQEVNTARENLTVAMSNLKERPPVWLVISLIGVLVFTLFLIFSLVWRKTKPRREEKKRKKIEDFTITQAPPVFSQKTAMETDYRQLVQQQVSQALTSPTQIPPQSQGSICGETTVFSQINSDETCVLRKEEIPVQMQSYMCRVCNNESITINKSEFVMGKDPSQTDYHITGNQAVSRMHAVIMRRGYDYYIADKRATNGTFVNGIRILPYQEMQLHDGDRVRLADEEFIFKISQR